MKRRKKEELDNNKVIMRGKRDILAELLHLPFEEEGLCGQRLQGGENCW